MEYCAKVLTSRSKYLPVNLRRCFRPSGHSGKCDEFTYLAHLSKVAPKVANKIVRDAIMTTGASWKSEDAGPNRILRWVMLLPDEELAELGINMGKLKPQVVAKLREKAADYGSCMAVAVKLTGMAYCMPGAPKPPADIAEYLSDVLGALVPESTVCLVCREPLPFALFAEARRGKAEVETSHSNPRLHTLENVGFAHRACNIAQGNKTLDEFYGWIAGILARARPR